MLKHLLCLRNNRYKSDTLHASQHQNIRKGWLKELSTHIVSMGECINVCYVLNIIQAIVLAPSARKLQNCFPFYSLNFPLQTKIEEVVIKYLRYVHA